jgi:excisionase family DNA binding protein
MTNYPPLLSRKAASEMTGLSPRYFDRLRREGKLGTYKTIGGHHRFYRDEILKHISQNESQKNPLELSNERPDRSGV